MRSFLLLFLALNLTILSSCTEKPSPLENKEVVKLNIGYFSEQHFDDRYASLLALEYPNLQYTIVPTSDILRRKITVSEWAKNNDVDLIYLPSNQFQLAINNGLLQPFDNYIDRDSFPLENMVPSIVDLTKQYGNGKLYGLPPTFYGSALVYNQQLFDQYGVDYPTEQMTWEDIIVLANRFPKGLSLPYPSTADWLIDIGQTENLHVYDEQRKQITLNNPSWTKILELVKEPLQRGNIAFNDINKNSFISENYAMAVVNYEDINSLEQQGSELKWKLVTMPVNPASPQSSHHVSLGGLWSIPSTSSQADAAWELIQFFMSGKVAEWEYRSVYGFSSLASYTSLGDRDRNFEAFYKLQPIEKNNVVPDQIYNLINESVDQIVSGNKTVQQVLDEIPSELSQ
ncbi:ABC transporter substrate-binding protein [Paenibacillus oralis]|uniref:ABC transporter substrate-binding protein n=1 Tax=Paenibacillus oralis TaxID=2490856 RepID=UPI0015A89585|nr:extracellular solute-binding protein [Paenibacillus oralis]